MGISSRPNASALPGNSDPRKWRRRRTIRALSSRARSPIALPFSRKKIASESVGERLSLGREASGIRKGRAGRLVIRRGEIYWIDFRGAIGAEIRKVRPAVVVSTDDHNEHMQTVTVVPFSSRDGAVRRYEVAVPAGAVGDGRPSRLKTHQLRAVDKSRQVGNRVRRFSRPGLMPVLERSIRRHLRDRDVLSLGACAGGSRASPRSRRRAARYPRSRSASWP